MLGGMTYLNNSAVIIEEIGEGVMNSLKCTTAYDRCCQTVRRGEFYYPNNDVVNIESQAISRGESFYRTRSSGSINLNKQSGDPAPLGRYRCEIPDSRGILQNLYITIGEFCRYVIVIACKPEYQQCCVSKLITSVYF